MSQTEVRMQSVDEAEAAHERWHAERMARLRAEDGWLALVALAWVDPGVHRVGRTDACSVRADGFGVDHVGDLEVRADGTLRFIAAPGVVVDGLPGDGVVRADDTGPPTTLRSGSCTFFVIRRAGRLAVRVRDAHAPLRTSLPTPALFPFDPAWAVELAFTPAASGTRSMTRLVIGAQEEMTVSGRATGKIGNERVDLLLFTGAAEDRFLLVFGDATNGRDTYGGGRFVEAVHTAPDRVCVDFNRAYCPPCAFSPYATCPLPPDSNRLSLRVDAGEMLGSGDGVR